MIVSCVLCVYVHVGLVMEVGVCWLCGWFSVCVCVSVWCCCGGLLWLCDCVNGPCVVCCVCCVCAWVRVQLYLAVCLCCDRLCVVVLVVAVLCLFVCVVGVP